MAASASITGTIVATALHHYRGLNYGGYAAIEHLRGVMAELNALTTRRALGLPTPWQELNEEGRFTATPERTKALEAALDELRWWAATLTDARTHRPFPG